MKRAASSLAVAPNCNPYETAKEYALKAAATNNRIFAVVYIDRIHSIGGAFVAMLPQDAIKHDRPNRRYTIISLVTPQGVWDEWQIEEDDFQFEAQEALAGAIADLAGRGMLVTLAVSDHSNELEIAS